MSDLRLAAFERAVRAVAHGLLRREICISEAMASLAIATGDAKDEAATPRESAAAARKATDRAWWPG